MSCLGTSTCTCGCCGGIAVETPQGESNLPGLSAIAYRTGTWASFRDSMLARLSSSDYPALAPLKTRDSDDFSIALLDASAVVMDILTFYQERLANESYLRTATQLRSLTELSRLIGYQPAPGISALVYLAFTLKAATGQPTNLATTAITIPAGTQVQSVPAQGQTPQTFETSAPILAKPDWDALPVRAANPWIAPGHSSLYLAGTSTQLNPGDSLLILGIDREEWTPSNTPSEQWDVVVLNQVVPDTQNNITLVSWDKRLTHETGSGTSGSPSSWSSAKIFAFRQKAALFGNNAPNPYLFVSASNTSQTSLPALINDCLSPWQWIWNNFAIPSASSIYLDAAYPKIVVGSWFALVNSGSVQLYNVAAASPISLAQYAISGKVTQLAADFADPHISLFPLQGTAVLAQSDQLTVAEQPLDHPLYGTVIDLQGLRPDLAAVQAVAIFGNSQKLSVNSGIGSLVFQPDDDSGDLTLKPGDVVTLIDPSPLPLTPLGAVPHWRHASAVLALRVADASGRTGTLNAALEDFSLAPAAKNDPVVQEYALVNSIAETDKPYPHTQLLLQNKLLNVYNRDNQSDGTTDVTFGDGVEGATLPTGQNNIQATYRVGSGLAGNVAAGAITTLIDRPLGVSGVVNPQAATGGQDPQSANDIRANAPLSVLTLGRAVSITDYQNFAASYAGIAKANALWIPSGPGRGVFLTVAAAGGVALPPGNLTLGKLVSSLQQYGNPLIPINPFTFLETLFSLSADLAYDPAYDQPTVQSAVQTALAQNYSFANRTFGQGVTADEVAALIQAVPGVIAVNVTNLAVGPTSSAGDITGGAWSLAAYSNWIAQPVTLIRPNSGSPTRICPYLPVPSSTGMPQPAEILVLDPDPNAVSLGAMS